LKERRIIVRLLTILVVFTLIFASCSSGPASVSKEPPAAESAPGRAAASGNAAAPGKIPVEKKALIKFADGTLDEYTVSEYDPSDITLLAQNRFSASGGLIDQIEFTYNDERQVVTTKMTKDDENRLKSRIVNEYDESAVPPRLLKETVVNKAGKPVSVNTYTYNGNGKVAERSILNGVTVLAKTIYSYDESGDLIIASRTVNGKGNLISSSKNEYNKDGNLVTQVMYNKDGAVTRRISTVWQDGREMVITQTSGDGKLQIRTTNEYGSAGELVKRTIENIQGNSKQIMEFEYEFRRSRGKT
jgi:hypothetical protein